MAVSAVPALFGRRRFGAATLAAFVIGLAGGTLFGKVKNPTVPCEGHYGWLIWLVCFLLGIVAGAVWERRAGRKGQTGEQIQTS